jgi:hypothetical protein
MVQGLMSGPANDDRDRDPAGRARNTRARDELGRPLDERYDAVPADEPALPPAAALTRAQELLDAGRPFTAHEVLEAVWKASEDPERPLWRGLAQVAVGITHALRGNDSGARALLERGAASLAPYAGSTPHGIDVDGVRTWAAAATGDLAMTAAPPVFRRHGSASGHGPRAR